MKYFGGFLAMLLLFTSACAGSERRGEGDRAAAVIATDLRCEYLVDPLGLDVARPRLSWKLEAIDPGARGLRQSAYRILAASSRERLARDEGDLWDSGRVTSSRTTHLEWGGAALRSRQACFWKVRSWTGDGLPSSWSAPARWTMGLLERDDWTAEWVGAAPAPGLFGDAKWIWYDEGEPATSAPVGNRFFRRAVEIPAGRQVVRAEMRIAVDDAFALFVDDEEVARGDSWERPVTVDLAVHLGPGSHRIDVGAVNRGHAAGMIARLVIEFDGGDPSVVESDATWQASDDYEAWSAARELGAYGMEPWGEVRAPFPADPWLRRSFELDAVPAEAFVYVASLGYHELWINGAKVSEDVLAPSVSDLTQRVRYVTHEVAAHLKPGRNTIGLWLGGGWAHFPTYAREDKPIAIAQLELPGPDGGRRIVTDDTWRVRDSNRSLRGAWRFGWFGGERVDGRFALPEWCDPGLDDADWSPATTYTSDLILSAEKVEPNRRVKEYRPIAIEERAPGVWRVDMRHNFTGWIEMTLRGTPGETATLGFAEREDQERTYTQHAEVIFGESGEEVFRHRFNYAAARWITVRGVREAPRADEIRGWLVRTAYRRVGNFSCSNELYNRIFETVRHTYESLSLGGYVVDCPHRERQGYGGDAHATMETSLALFEQGAFHTKWLEDWRDVQSENGNVPYTAPTYEGGGGPAWSGVCIALPWELYVAYGDRRILEECYPMMQRWLAFLDTQCRVEEGDDEAILHRYGHENWGFLGDWVPPGRQQNSAGRVDEESTLFFNNCYRFWSVRRMARIAQILERPDDAGRYAADAERIGGIVHERFFDPATATYANGEQPYLAFPLLAGLVPPEHVAAVSARLEREILEVKQGHVDSGIHGTYFLLKQLTESGRSDLAATMIAQTDYPSWGHMLEEGATTIWEQWDGEHSRLHSSFLSVGAWFVEGVVGLRADPEHPGFERFFIRPGLVGGLTSARTRFDSIRGPITVAWNLDGETLSLDFEVPPNASAIVSVPAISAGAVQEDGGGAEHSPGVRLVGFEDGWATFEVGSGRYAFVSRVE